MDFHLTPAPLLEERELLITFYYFRYQLNTFYSIPLSCRRGARGEVF